MWKLTANKETAPGSWHWCADAGTPAVGSDADARKFITYSTGTEGAREIES